MTFTTNEIPLSPQAQTFAISLAGVTYNINLYWCPANTSWMIDILDVNGNALITGIPLVTGADLLAQYEYVGIGGQLRVQTDNNPDATPTISNLGTNSHVYFVTSP